MKRTMVVIASLVFCVGCAVAAPHDNGEDVAGALASWPHYATVDELVGASSVIVRGTVVEKMGEVVRTGAPTQRFPVALTEFRFRVERTLKGNAGSHIVVIQPGRAGDPSNTYGDFPLMRAGSRMLLFLYPSTEPPLADGTSKYGIVSPDGLYEVIGSTVTTRSEQVSLRNAAAKGLDSFERAVAATVGAR